MDAVKIQSNEIKYPLLQKVATIWTLVTALLVFVDGYLLLGIQVFWNAGAPLGGVYSHQLTFPYIFCLALVALLLAVAARILCKTKKLVWIASFSLFLYMAAVVVYFFIATHIDFYYGSEIGKGFFSLL